jgi:hypothetical protein
MRFRACSIAALAIVLTAVIGAQEITYSHKPGFYNADLTLAMSVPLPYRLTFSFPDSLSPREIPYTRSLELTALQGERRTYRLLLAVYEGETLLSRREETWTIDKDAPEPPVLSIPSGEYPRDVSFVFTVPEKDASVWYSINERVEEAVRWNGRPVLLPYRQGVRSEYHIVSYIVDSAGNCSMPSYHLFVTGKQPEREQSLYVLSPLPGVYLNPQLLVIDSNGYEWVRYIIGTGDPVKEGTYYNGPVLIRNTGAVSLSIAAMPIGGKTPLVKNIPYTVRDTDRNQKGISPSPPQGIYTGESRYPSLRGVLSRSTSGLLGRPTNPRSSLSS